MVTVGICQAKNSLFELVERAAGGEEIEITRGDQVVARLLSPVCRDAARRGRALAIRIRRGREGHTLGDDIELADLISEGRR